MGSNSKTIIDRQHEEKDLFIETLSQLPNISWACGKTDIPRSTIYRWQSEDMSFKERVKTAIRSSIASVNDKAEANIISAINNGDTKCSKYWLEHHKENYAPNGTIHGDHKTEDELGFTEKFQRNLLGQKEIIW